MSQQKLKEFEEIHNYFLKLINENGEIPSDAKINKDELLPKPQTIRGIYYKKFDMSYFEYYKSLGYAPNKFRPIDKYTTYDDFVKLWELFYAENGRYPRNQESLTDKRIPERHKLKKLLGSRHKEFKDYFKEKELIISYDNYCRVYIEESNKLGRPLSINDLDAKNEYSEILPSAKWFVYNSPENIKSFRDFYQSLGFRRKDELSKDEVVSLIMKKRESLGRNLMSVDFHDSDLFNPQHVGFGAINKYWGSFNNMLLDLGLPINQEDMINKNKPMDELKNDIIKLCNYIKDTEKRNVISYKDIEDCEWCLTSQVYSRRFKLELGLTLSDYIRSLGFDANDSGNGMVYRFDDGEITTSSYEYKVSNYLRSNDIVYERNVKYDSFSEYKGRKDCDYVINGNGDYWYVEVAGMINNIEDNSTSIKETYIRNLKEKIRLLEKANLNYIILYVEDLKSKSIDELFSFIDN